MARLIRINDNPVRFVRPDVITYVEDASTYTSTKTIVHLQGGGIVYVDANVFDVVKKIDAASSAEGSSPCPAAGSPPPRSSAS